MKEINLELTEDMADELGRDKTAQLRDISEMIRCDMLRYNKILDVEEEIDED